jgi:hypothetical protein
MKTKFINITRETLCQDCPIIGLGSAEEQDMAVERRNWTNINRAYGNSATKLYALAANQCLQICGVLPAETQCQSSQPVTGQEASLLNQQPALVRQ